MQIREILEGLHPGRTYTAALLSRLIRNAKEMHFGTDPDCMTSFFESGFAMRANGGVFHFRMNLNQQLVTVFMQVLYLSL